jgi:hypothetical protein
LDLLVEEEEGGGGLQQQDNGMRSGKMAQEWCQERIVEEGGPEDPEYWESRALHELCAQVTQSTLESPGTPHGLKEFAEQASQVELRILLATCLERAGYEYNPEDIGIHNRRGGQGQEETFCISSQVPEQSKMQEPIDFHAAQKAANKISSAHIDSFRSNQFVLLRNTLATAPSSTHLSSNTLKDPQQVISVAAGLACRLLHSSACRLIRPVENSSPSSSSRGVGGVHVFLPVTEVERTNCATFLSQLNFVTYGGGEIMVGDANVVTTNALIDSNSLSCCYTFAPCEKGDAAVCFVDQFHGTRGETPTTVIQWSKGTIFEMDKEK